MARLVVGPYSGDGLSVDHIVLRAVVPELDNVIANLELMPLEMNRKKMDEVGERQVSLAEEFHAVGLLNREGLEKVKRTLRRGLGWRWQARGGDRFDIRTDGLATG